MVEEIEYEDGTSKIEVLSKKARGRKLMDQKANSVADMAAVLGEVGMETEGEEKKEIEEGEQGGDEVVVEVRWRDLTDAEFARTWPDNVLHDVLEGGNVESAYGEAIKAAEAKLASEAETAVATEKKPEGRVTV
jgi:hypothetical protein